MSKECKECGRKLRLTKKKGIKEVVFFCDECRIYYDCETSDQLEEKE